MTSMIQWKRTVKSGGRVRYRPVWERFVKLDGSIGYRPKRRWPQWYTIPRVRPGELLGSLNEDYVRCGKPNCRCASKRPQDMHIAWYRRWRDDNGKHRKADVRKRDVEKVRVAIERRRRRLAKQRVARLKHMRRGPYSWKAQHPEEYAEYVLGRDEASVEQVQALLRLYEKWLG